MRRRALKVVTSPQPEGSPMLDLANAKAAPARVAPPLRLAGPQVVPQAISLAILGNFPPRRCGIATFTSDLYLALIMAEPRTKAAIYAMDDGRGHDFPPEVAMAVPAGDPAAYAEAAARINASNADVVSIQHEFGIFGGPAGSHLLVFLEKLRKPVVTTLHTVLSAPNADQRRVMQRLIARSHRLVVMSERGRRILMDTYDTPSRKIAVAPHGAPDRPFTESAPHKAALGLAQRDVLLTFGLLSPGKGLDVMIRALPRVVEARPNALYVILGATHPNIVAEEGEAYREGLVRLAEELGVADNVLFLNAYVDTDMLLGYLSACDVYVTPYLNEAQATSGTLAYAVALGKPVVSTPYWHAAELLADERGVLTPFGDSDALGREIVALLTDDRRRDEIRANAYAAGRATTWSRSADAYLQLFALARAEDRRMPALSAAARALPRPRLDAVVRMSDSTGILQHGVFCVPDRNHGYCTDDNARALMLMAEARSAGVEADRALMQAGAYAAFIQHAWNEDRGCFRNFMSFDRRWLEDRGSGDSFGRALLSLAVVAKGGLGEDYARWASVLFERALPHAAKLTPLRSRAFVALACAAYLEAHPNHPGARDALSANAAHLAAQLEIEQRTTWVWFEPTLGYDNARLPEALLRAGRALGASRFSEAGSAALSWLCEIHTGAGGVFRPVGSESFGKPYADASPFDQQPLEALAAIDACGAAYAVDGDTRWLAEAQRALDWFLGENDLAVPLADPKTGDCYDGLGRAGPNLNRGAESVLAFQQALIAMQSLARSAKREPTRESAKDILAR